MQKLKTVVMYFIPVLVMIGFIPFVANDYYLSLIYIGFIVALLGIRSEKNDGAALVFGLVAVTISEYFFISTGVETFTRTSLLGVMPLWLPILWGYVFVSIKRSLRVLDRE